MNLTSRTTPPPTVRAPPPTRLLLDQSQATYRSMIDNVDQALDIVKRAVATEEREYDDMLSRTREMDRAVLQRKDAEIEDLRRVVASKEKALDSLREIMTSQKRALEARVADGELQMERVASELKDLREKIMRLQSDNAMLDARAADEERARLQAQGKLREMGLVHAQLERDLTAEKAQLEAAREQTDEIRQQVETLMSERTALAGDKADLMRERTELQAAVAELTKAKAQMEAEVKVEKQRGESSDSLKTDFVKLEAALQMETYKKKKAIEKLHHERERRSDTHMIDEAVRRLSQERRTRRALEKWLHSELKSREEMDGLFVAIRDMALSSASRPARTSDMVRELVSQYERKNDADRTQREALKSDVYAALRDAEKSTNAVKDRLEEIKSSISKQLSR